MTKFTFFFRGGNPKGVAEGRARQPRWDDWFQTLGSKVADRGGAARSFGIAGKSSPQEVLPLTSGYAIIEVSSREEAMDLATTCPIYDEGGVVEVARYVDPTTILAK